VGRDFTTKSTKSTKSDAMSESGRSPAAIGVVILVGRPNADAFGYGSVRLRPMPSCSIAEWQFMVHKNQFKRFAVMAGRRPDEAPC